MSVTTSSRAGGSAWSLPACVAAVAALAAAPACGVDGEIWLGWREVWLDGDEAKYRQHVNLDDGPRLFGLALDWRAGDEPVRALAPDRLELRLDELGGDPYESITIRAERAGRYQARYQRRESEYFYEDLLVLPENASEEKSTGGDFRHFDYRRIRDEAGLSVRLTERATLDLDFERYAKRGDSTTVLDIQREEFELERPVDETLESAAAGFSYTWPRATVSVTERYTTFDYGSSVFLPGLSPGSDPDGPTELELFFLDQPYDLESWEHRLDLRARPTDRLELGFTAMQMDVEVDLQAAERSQGTDFLGVPFSRNLQGEGALDQDRALYDLGAEYALTGGLSVFGSVRLVDLDQAGASRFDSAAVSDWRIEHRWLEAGIVLTPWRSLSLVAGVSGGRREVEYRQADEAFDDRAATDTDARGWFVRATLRPRQRLTVYLAIEDDTIDDPFSLASPTDATRYRLRASYRDERGWSASAGYQQTERRNDESGWRAESDQTDLRLGYAAGRLAISGGYTQVELDRSVDVLVIGGSAEALFAIDYAADADFADLVASWRLSPALTVGGSVRRYDNSGSFAVERDDARIYLRGRIGAGYVWGLDYRRIDFAEGGLEDFDADVLEVSLGLRW